MEKILKLTNNRFEPKKKSVRKNISSNGANNQFQKQLESLDTEIEASLGQEANTTLGAKQKIQSMNKYLHNLGNMMEKISDQNEKNSNTAVKQALTQYQNSKKEA